MCSEARDVLNVNGPDVLATPSPSLALMNRNVQIWDEYLEIHEKVCKQSLKALISLYSIQASK